MLWYVCLGIACAVIAVAAVGGAYLEFGKYKSGIWLKPFHLAIFGCFIGLLVLCIPAHRTEYGILTSIAFSFLDAIKSFGGDNLYIDRISAVEGLIPGEIRGFYFTLTAIIEFILPWFTFGFLLSLFKNAYAYAGYWRSFNKDVYVFSELNEKSLALATDIVKNAKHRSKVRIVFANAFDGEVETSELDVAAKELRSICFKKDIDAINFRFHSKKCRLYFFLMGDDEIDNISRSLELISEYSDRKNTHLYAFAAGVEGELLLAATKKGEMKVRRIDEIRSLVYGVLYEDLYYERESGEYGNRLFDDALPVGDGSEKQISAVIVGMGAYGTEMLRALSWYCQMDGYHIRINAFDKDPGARDRFAALCPELLSFDYNGVRIDGEAEYEIKIHSGIDVDTKIFADAISQISDATYVFVALGSEEKNIQVAADLRMHFERMGIKPYIQAVVGSNSVKEALSDVKNHAGQEYGLDFVGDFDTSYSERVIIDSHLEDEAFKIHKSYCDGDLEKEEQFWKFEYCYRSSMASAIHAKLRICYKIPGADLSEEELQKEEHREENEIITSLEHRRWNAYMRSDGFIYSGSPLKESRNYLAKKHHNLVEYRVLSESDIEKDRRVGAKK